MLLESEFKSVSWQKYGSEITELERLLTIQQAGNQFEEAIKTRQKLHALYRERNVFDAQIQSDRFEEMIAMPDIDPNMLEEENKQQLFGTAELSLRSTLKSKSLPLNPSQTGAAHLAGTTSVNSLFEFNPQGTTKTSPNSQDPFAPSSKTPSDPVQSNPEAQLSEAKIQKNAERQARAEEMAEKRRRQKELSLNISNLKKSSIAPSDGSKKSGF